ncbi:TolC family protein [Pontibacter sp. E15-1]|uniref:TolC family protein n=1 Tax=Pontibacter sp. E15-1 TaxID=2919918 RepID=UPI001F4F3938|nr:TolC family protein [Pontibacter sp. E15-1]MCJ8163616.1 TolC family protein [Pontibacter sp. E15-1]
MKHTLKHILLYCLICLNAPFASAQNKATEADDNWQAKFFTPALALPILMEAAVSHSAAVAETATEKLIAEEEVKLTKLNVLNSVSLVSGYNYGTLPFFGTNQAELNKVNAFALDARAQYTVGVNMNLPLDVLLGRRSAGGSVHKQQLVMQQANAAQKVEEEKIRQEVITLYQELLLAKTVLKHFQDALQSADITKNMTDKRFKDGNTKFEDQLTAIRFYNEAALDHEKAKNSYQTKLLLLEEMIGMTVSDLMRNR